MPAVRSTVSGKKRRSAAELEQPHGLLAVDWTDQARPVALRRSDLMEMQPRGQLGTGLAHRREQTGAVAGPSTAGHVRIVAVSCHRDAAEGRRHEYSPAIASAVDSISGLK